VKFIDIRKITIMNNNNESKEVWSGGDSYEQYVGRWSRLVAQEFIRWLAIPNDRRWLDVGCGTGALTQTILESYHPATVHGVDRSEAYVESARDRVTDPRAGFEVGNAQSLPVEAATYDAAVSGLVLNFVPQPERMIAEMARAVCEGGTVAVYVWDYAGKMQMMRHFWNAVNALDPAARDLDEGLRFPICNPDPLKKLFQDAGLLQMELRPIDIPTHFQNFDDYWHPFLGGQGPAPGYAMSLSEEQRARLRQRIYNSMPFAMDGSIPLVARAWAIKGIK
jgi:trans-aconitate methyltransferase